MLRRTNVGATVAESADNFRPKKEELTTENTERGSKKRAEKVSELCGYQSENTGGENQGRIFVKDKEELIFGYANDPLGYSLGRDGVYSGADMKEGATLEEEARFIRLVVNVTWLHNFFNRYSTEPAFEPALIDEYQAYCTEHKLPDMSCDELIAEIETELDELKGRV